MKQEKFTLRLDCNHPTWWRFNVLITARGYDEQGEVCGYYTLNDTIAPCNGENHPQPADYPTARSSELLCGPCTTLECYLYVLPHTLPEESDLDHTPSFEATLSLHNGKRRLYSRTLAINPWGGATFHLLWPEAKNERE